MLATLSDPILPIFAVLIAGYLLAKAGMMQASHAQAMNSFVFYLGAPALVAAVIGKTPVALIDWTPVAVYFTAEVMLWAAVFAVLRFGLKRDTGEALLLGLAACFANHIFFVLPIAERLYGPIAGQAMAGIVLLDVAVLFTGAVILTEFLASAHHGIGKVMRRMLRNPFVYAPFLGLILSATGDTAPAGLWTFLEFASKAAAPVVLFALGITLAGAPLTRIGTACWIAVGAKLVLHPVLVFAGLAATGSEAFSGAGHIALLVAAGPGGVTPFVIATQYGIRTEAIAKAILISTAVSVISLSVLT